MDKRYMASGTSMLVLKLLKQQNTYGYQIIQILDQKSQNVFRLQEGTLYPILHTLEQQGAVTMKLLTMDAFASIMQLQLTDRNC